MTPIKHLLNAEGEEGLEMACNSMNQSPLCSDDELSGGAQSPRRENSSVSSGSARETSIRNHSPGCTSDTSQDTETDETQMLICQWDSCGVSFPQPELLYHHLCKDHVGRKAQRNLQLNCHWGSCTTTTMKRDHITSHLRVHVPLKPFSCSTCNRKFKRPQDLKKHLRVHMHDAVKNKRGPKLGSKRVKKTTYGNANELKTSATLPSLTLERFVREEIDNYYPCYSQGTYDPSTRILLPPPKSHSMVPAERMHSSEVGTAMLYFSTLSKNMMRKMPDTHANQETQGTQSGVLPLPHPQLSFSASRNYAGGHTLPPLTSCVYGGMGDDSLPRLHNGRGSSSLAAPQLPSLNSFTQTQWPHTRHRIFSLNQKASMDSDDEEDELVASLASLSVRRSENMCSELQIINIIKDYLLCMLMEEVFPDASLEDNKTTMFTPDIQQSALKRYPQVKV